MSARRRDGWAPVVLADETNSAVVCTSASRNTEVEVRIATGYIPEEHRHYRCYYQEANCETKTYFEKQWHNTDKVFVRIAIGMVRGLLSDLDFGRAAKRTIEEDHNDSGTGRLTYLDQKVPTFPPIPLEVQTLFVP